MNMAMDDRIRAADADREHIAARLREHYAEGRLTQDELDERISAALSAKTYGDLRRVMADLPEPGLAPQPWGWPASAAPGPVMVRRRGPSLLPLAFLFLFVALLLPGGGWLFLGFFQAFLMFALIAAGVAIFAASRARRRIRRHWPERGYPGSWGWPTGHMQ
jgi:Domain of unknown function (DUF1707)